MKLILDLDERKAEALADRADRCGMADAANALRRAVRNAHRNHFALKVETESDEPVRHDQIEPNDPIVREFEFELDDIADFVAEYAPLAAKSAISNAVYDMLYYLPDYIADLIADHYAEDDDFKEFVAERKGE